MAKPRRVTDAARVAPGGPKAKKKRPVWLRVGLWMLVTLVSLGLVGIGIVAYSYMTIRIPDPNTDFKTNTTFVYYADGKTEIGSFQIQNRTTISYDEMPQYVKDAIVAAENRTFWDDPGISVPGLFRAALGLVGIQSSDNTATGGGSTITQQYIKILYLTQERTFARKFTELLLAAKVGQSQSKEQILEGYLNTVYFGRGAYGIEAAAQAYFNKTAAKLTLAQSVALAAIVNSPGNLDPANGDKQAADLLERYQYTLNGMVELGTITESQKAKIYYELPKFAAVNDSNRLGGQTGYLLAIVKSELLAKGFTEEQITGGGYKVVTTFVKANQDAAVEAAEKQTLATVYGDKKKAKNLHAAIASIDNATGGVLALYGGTDYVKNNRNWATTARQTGSSFKPYALTAALREGWTLQDKLNGNTTYINGEKSVTNAGGTNYGRVTLLQATTHSINTAYYDLVNRMDGGAAAVEQAANDAGVPTGAGWDLNPRMPLGTPEVSPIDQASGYSTFANYGVHRDWHVVAQVLDASGNQVYAPDTSGTQTIEHEVTQDVNYALEHVAQDGTGRVAAGLGYPVAGKTGSKGQPSRNNKRSRETIAAWFVGYTAQITTSVMYVAGDDGNHPLEDYNTNFFGGTFPALTWLAYMRKAMAGKDRIDFEEPTKRVSTQKPEPAATSATTSELTTSASPSASAPAPETSAPAPETSAPAPETSAPPATSEAPATSAPAAAPTTSSSP